MARRLILSPAGNLGASAAAILAMLAAGAYAGGALGRMATGRGRRAWDQGSRLAAAGAWCFHHQLVDLGVYSCFNIANYVTKLGRL